LDDHGSQPFLLSAVSDERGEWQGELEIPVKRYYPPLTCSDVYVFVHKQGEGCDFIHYDYLRHDETKDAADYPSPRRLQLVLPSAKASLEVQAVHDGKPVAGAIVRIAHEYWPKVYPATAGSAEAHDAQARLERILYPWAKADESGVARFDDLAPGTYRIITVTNDSPHLKAIHVDPELQSYSGGYRAVALPAGESRRFVAAVFEESNRVPLQILQPSGKSASWESTGFQYCRVSDSAWAVGSGSWIDNEGRADFHFPSAGLWRMASRERAPGNRQVKVNTPCYEASAVVGVSPLLEKGAPIVMTERWVEQDDPPAKKHTENRRSAKPVDVAGRVLHADGLTPALGAILFTILPDSEYILRQSHADAAGYFRTQHVYGLPRRWLDGDLSGSPTEAAIVAILPGRCGATVVPFAEFTASAARTIRLPMPISLRGKVTVGGKSPLMWNNQFRIFAGYEGRGSLNESLSLLVSAEADGSFELAGLTPGRYRIQAAMDDIWLSSSVTVEVTVNSVRGAGIEPLTLDVGLPGAPSVIHCIDKEGKPLVGVELHLQRPPGPLTERLWPTTLVSDGAGVVNVPPLEAGRHLFRVSNEHVDRPLAVNELLPGYKPQIIKLTMD
jgi:hypothetical protein